MSDLSTIRYKVNEQQRINNELHAELNEIASGVSTAYNKWNNLCNHVSNTMNNGAQRVKRSHDYILAAYELQGEIDKMYVLFKNIELANKKIRACNNKKIYDFANYSAVRKIVNAMLDNLEIALVSDEAITRAVEIKHLQLPDYWLTCAMLSIMAWRNDDKDLAERALARACDLDKKNSSVFFLVFNLRVGRETAALKWFEYYQSCERTGDDERTFLMLFSIISRVIKESCSDTIRDQIRVFINKVLAENMNKNGYSEEDMINRIIHYLHRFVPNDKIEYPVLAKYCLEVDYLNDEMMQAKANIGILDFILKTVNVTNEEKKDYLNEFISEIIKKPNDVEIETEDEIKYNELIISNKGDVETAKAQFAEMKSRRESEFDIVLEMIDWTYKSGSENINPMVKLNIFTLTKYLNLKSFKKHIDGYRDNFKSNLKIKINDYETVANFKNSNEEKGKLKQFFESKKQELLAQIKLIPAFIGFGVCVLALVGGIALAAAPLFVIAAIGALWGVFYILHSNVKKKRIAEECNNEYLASEKIMDNIFAEFEKYKNEYTEYDKYADRIEEEMNKI